VGLIFTQLTAGQELNEVSYGISRRLKDYP
jgi:hypothetical protein